jgi:hypothetical protein
MSLILNPHNHLPFSKKLLFSSSYIGDYKEFIFSGNPFYRLWHIVQTSGFA